MRMAWRVAKQRASGKKAYTVGALMVLVAVTVGMGYGAFVPAMLSPADPGALLFEGLALIFLRQGVAKIRKETLDPFATNPRDRLKLRKAGKS